MRNSKDYWQFDMISTNKTITVIFFSKHVNWELIETENRNLLKQNWGLKEGEGAK